MVYFQLEHVVGYRDPVPHTDPGPSADRLLSSRHSLQQWRHLDVEIARGDEEVSSASPLGLGSASAARRHRHYGQSRQPQEQDRPPTDPIGRRQTAVPAEVLPDLNPIEQVFAKLRHLLRKAAARTVEAVCAAIGELLGAFTKNECANYFKNSRYAAN
jgi:hypothetical protein